MHSILAAMDLHERYRRALDEKGFSRDDAQLRAIDALNRVGRELRARGRTGGIPGALRRWLPGRSRPPAPVKGVYLWGGVGRGKTFVMDLFFDSLPFEDKLRFHFHRLMYRVHGRLKTLRAQDDPLAVVADDLARQARVICFDEFFVADIADAMILARLLDALFRRNVTLVTTSNIRPADLYRHGLQRQRFLPAIQLLEAHTEVVHVGGDTDYRLRVLEQAEIYHSPLDAAAEDNLDSYFRRIAPGAGTTAQPIEVLGRNLATRRRADGIVWFDFRELCAGPRSQDDYIEIARCFQTVILSGVPALDASCDDHARRFIALVDEFYDRRVNLIVSAAVTIDRLYSGSRLAMEFERTQSRLREMQSMEYLAARHVP